MVFETDGPGCNDPVTDQEQPSSVFHGIELTLSGSHLEVHMAPSYERKNVNHDF